MQKLKKGASAIQPRPSQLQASTMQRLCECLDRIASPLPNALELESLRP